MKVQGRHNLSSCLSDYPAETQSGQLDLKKAPRAPFVFLLFAGPFPAFDIALFAACHC
jgi:hypothetical protein